MEDVLDKADEFIEQYNYEMAQKFLERALEINSDHPRALETAASLLLEVWDFWCNWPLEQIKSISRNFTLRKKDSDFNSPRNFFHYEFFFLVLPQFSKSFLFIFLGWWSWKSSTMFGTSYYSPTQSRISKIFFTGTIIFWTRILGTIQARHQNYWSR